MESKAPIDNSGEYEQLNTSEQGGKKNMNGYILAGIILLLFVPVIYLFVNSKKTEEKAETAAAKPEEKTNNVAALEQALEKAPTFQNYINLGIAYQQNGMAKRSIRIFEKAIELQPNSAIAYNDLGVGYIMISQFKDAENALAKAIMLDPNFQLAKNNIAWMEDERKHFMEEIKKLEAVAEGERTSQQWIELGLKYFALGDYQKSIDLFNKCVEKDPKNSLAYNNIGTSYMLMGKYDEAKASFQKALELEDQQLYKNNLKWAEDVAAQKKAEQKPA